MKWGFKFWLGLFSSLLAITFLTTYAYEKSKDLLRGPIIVIIHPAQNSVVHSPLISINGYVKNATTVTLDDRPIFLTTTGQFTESLLLPLGLSYVTLKATDRYHATTTKQITLEYTTQ